MLKTSPLRRRSARTAAKQARRGQQRGMMILESLVSIMIVMLGIVGIASLLAKSTALSGQAQYRTEAGMFAEQIIQMISLSVDRSTPDTLAASLKTFEHQGSGGNDCDFSGGTVSDSTPVGELLKAARGDLNNVAGLPGAKAAWQQVQIDTTNNINKVSVKLCWQGSTDLAKRNYEIHAFVH